MSAPASDLPAWPGSDMHQHAALDWLRISTSCLITHGLLGVADGGMPVECESIVDYDLSRLPPAPAHDDPSYIKWLDTRMKWEHARQ